MPETSTTRASGSPRWLHCLFAVVAVVALGFGLGAEVHHAEAAAWQAPAEVAATPASTVAADAQLEAAGALGGVVAICATVLLACAAFVRRRTRIAAPDLSCPRIPRARHRFAVPPQPSIPVALSALSISRT